MASTTEIANLALSHLGSAKVIANLDNENTQEAKACRRFFETSRDATLRDYAWPFATKFAALALVETLTSDTREWEYSYRYPNDCLEFRRIRSGNRNDTRQSRIPYRILSDDTGLLIYTDQTDATCEYTVQKTNSEHYPLDFVIALSWRLAFYIAPRLAGGDAIVLQNRAMEMYQIEISKAVANAMNEKQPEEENPSDLERARDGLLISTDGQDLTIFPSSSSVS